MANFNITVTEQENSPPTIGDGSRTTNYGTDIILTRSDFTTNTTPPYSDPEGDLPLTLRIDALPTAGLLKLNGVNVTVNQEISFINDIDAGNLTYAPDLNVVTAQSVDFAFSIADEGSGLFVS